MNIKNEETQVLVKQTTIDVAKKTSKRFNGINTPEIKMIIDETFNVIKEMILDGNYVVIQGLGVFYTDYLDEVDIKDPRNNDIIHFQRRKVPRFYFSRNFKKQIKTSKKK